MRTQKILYDLLILLLGVLILILIRIITASSAKSGIYSNTVKQNADMDPHFSYGVIAIKNYQYEIKRDIFNFAGPVIKDKIKISKPQLKENIIYQGLIIAGKKKIAVLVSDNIEYMASEGDMVDNKYRLIKITPDLLLFYDIDKKEHLNIKKESDSNL